LRNQDNQVRDGFCNGEHLIEVIQLPQLPQSTRPPKVTSHLECRRCAAENRSFRFIKSATVMVKKLVDSRVRAPLDWPVSWKKLCVW
jgi:hypothetical protein